MTGAACLTDIRDRTLTMLRALGVDPDGRQMRVVERFVRWVDEQIASAHLDGRAMDREVTGCAVPDPRAAALGRDLEHARGLVARLWEEVAAHRRDDCQGRGCAIHHPTDHPMREWPTSWRPDRRVVERVCPHGVGHPDPDDAAYRASLGDVDSVHGCDGCC